MACPHCGFTLADADARFGTGEVALGRLADTAGVFRRGERKRVAAAIDRFGRRFPQLFVAVYTGTGGGSLHLREFGFWLLNHAVFEDVPKGRPNAAAVMIVLDPSAKAASISFGYLLDPFLSQDDTFECLSRAHSWWLERRYCEGVLRVITHLETVLRRRSRQARRSPMRFAKKFLPPAEGHAEPPCEEVPR